MQIGGVVAQLPVVLPGNCEVVVRLGAGGQVYVTEAARFLDALARPDAGVDIVRHANLGQQVQRDFRELLARAALQEQHLVVGGNRHQVAQVLLGLLGDRNVGIAAVAHFHYRQATALPIKKLGLGAAQHRFGKRGGAGAEVKGAFAHCCFSHARCSDSPQGYKRLAGRFV